MTPTTRNIVARGSIRIDADRVIAINFRIDGEEFGIPYAKAGRVQLLLDGGGKITIMTDDAEAEAQGWADLMGWPSITVS